MVTELHVPKVAELGHLGIHCFDINKQLDFYARVLGLTVTGQDKDNYFLSARPDTEHHELILTNGRESGLGYKLIQQISFRCSEFEDVLGFYRKLKDNSTKLEMTVSHGNSIGVYFFDPEGNRVEVYWQTGLEAKQWFTEHIDIEDDPERLMDAIRDSVHLHDQRFAVDELEYASGSQIIEY